ncbi:MAG: glycosyl transferase group 1 [Bacteroidetes bacterium QH_8_67_23]|nr:MAG: glycosyl transferase group 1 [Bacteroidetes bacterium QH_8_67_23]
MTVCDLTYAYNEVSGGIRTYIDAKRRYIRDHTDWRHLLIIPGAEDAFSQNGRLATRRIRSPVLPGAAPYRLIWRVDKVLRALRRRRPDLIELGSLYTLPWAAFYYRRHHPSCRVVGFYHTDLPSVYVRPVVSQWLGERAGTAAFRLAARYVRALYGRCDATVTASPALREKLAATGVHGAHCISLGVNLETFHPRRRSTALRRRFGVEDDGLLLVYAGRFDTEKRVRMLVEVLEHLPGHLPTQHLSAGAPPASLVLAGQGPLEEELRQKAQSTPGLHVVPFVKDKKELARLLASADGYLAGNPNETFGLSVVEAQACGLPVVGVGAGALVERVPEAVGALGPVDDPEAMARNVARLVSEGALRERGERARALVEDRFSWTRTFDQITALYREL